MRSLLFALVATAVVSATGTQCTNDVEELVSGTTCGCSKKITACLTAVVNLPGLDGIEKCFVAGGCSDAEAIVAAVWLAKDCNRGKLAANKEDLKKRADSTSNIPSTTAKTSAQTTAKTTAATTASEPSSTPASTTSDSTSASTVAFSTPATPSSTTTDSTTSTSSTDSTTQTTASTTGPLVCSVTSIKSTSQCSIHAGTTVTCIPTTTAVASCAPGLLCFSATAGADATCMKKNNTLTTSGLVVTIVFGVGISAALLSWFVIAMRTRSRNRHRAQVAAMMASSGGKTSRDVEVANPFGAKRMGGSEANLPLITPGGTRSDQAYGQEAYSDANSGNPAPVPPKLHRGLGALK